MRLRLVHSLNYISIVPMSEWPALKIPEMLHIQIETVHGQD